MFEGYMITFLLAQKISGENIPKPSSLLHFNLHKTLAAKLPHTDLMCWKLIKLHSLEVGNILS